MGIAYDQILKAERRASDLGADIASIVAAAADKPPVELSSPQTLADRRRFFAETLGDRNEAETAFERLVEGDELQPVNYLQHGVVAARPVCRLRLRNPDGAGTGYATGFLIAPGVALTNHHVFPSATAARSSLAEFDVELDVYERPKTSVVFGLDPGRLFYTCATLDFSVVAVQPTSDEGGRPLSDYGFLPLIEATGKVAEGEWLTIIQHPGGKEKQVCIRENKLVARTDDVLWYRTDTLGGSSGSPVFNNSWQVVALHHQGVPERRNGVMQTVDGRDFEPARDTEDSIKWIANEGIRISRVAAELRRALPDEALLEPVFAMTPARAKAQLDALAARLESPSSPVRVEAARPPDLPPPRAEPAMPTRSVTLTLDISDDGGVSLRPTAGAGQPAFMEAARPETVPRARRPAPDYEVDFDPDYGPSGPRKGFDPAFLGNGFEVQLPDLGPLAEVATPLIGAPSDHVLNYLGYSLVMHKERKFAIYTAANVDGSHRHKLGRPHDQWRYDPRIPRSAQIGDFYYKDNKFDRGHLTRYEDMEYGGSPGIALQSAADTLHWTNCTPQHSEFNERQALWQGLETHLLEGAIKTNQFRAQILTGPVLDESDPVWTRYDKIQYPLRFWKIAVARTSANAMFATAFILDQSEVIARFGLERTVEAPFSPYKTFQVPIAEVERLTGLRFRRTAKRDLSDVDPLRVGAPARRRIAARPTPRLEESLQAVGPASAGYVLLEDESDIVRF